jgi:hypothetical protein
MGGWSHAYVGRVVTHIRRVVTCTHVGWSHADIRKEVTHIHHIHAYVGW